jgi:hypothetical protein
LYDFLVCASALSRDKVKLGVLRDVVAKKGCYSSVVEDAFALHFPSVLEYIRSVNSVGDDSPHGNLIRALQRAESRLVVETIAPKLLGKVPVVTLHDAVYTTTPCLPAVEDAFAETFERLGFYLSLKRED